MSKKRKEPKVPYEKSEYFKKYDNDYVPEPPSKGNQEFYDRAFEDWLKTQPPKIRERVMQRKKR